ncbi:hypothetical protein [Microbispora hainanensis]|uniref:hypothetical protein n=1 Tax=Microbispora hainanensis TaxID=568844 RepID=UPI00324957B0
MAVAAEAVAAEAVAAEAALVTAIGTVLGLVVAVPALLGMRAGLAQKAGAQFPWSSSSGRRSRPWSPPVSSSPPERARFSHENHPSHLEKHLPSRLPAQMVDQAKTTSILRLVLARVSI